MLRKIGAVAGTFSVVLCRPPAELAEAALEEFELEVATQLLERKLMLPQSELLAVEVPTFEKRIDSACEKQKAHAAEELRRLLWERGEADRILAQEKEDRQRELHQEAKELERLAAQKLRDRRHKIGIQLADRLEKFALSRKLETLELWGGSHYSISDICGHLRNHGYSEEKIESLSKRLTWLERNTR